MTHANFGDDFPDVRAIMRAAAGHDAGDVIGVRQEMNAAADAVVAQTVDNLETELCKGIEPDTAISTQDEFLTMLDELLDNTLHDEHCYITPNDTVCVCIVGRLRAVLPPCGAVQLSNRLWGDGEVETVTWKCLRNAHPASPDRHYFGED